MSDSRCDPIDHHVGNRLFLARTIAGYSQSALARRLGLSFQQIQKYEKGANRISAGRLYRLANLMEVPVSFFFLDLPDEEGPSTAESIAGEAEEPSARIRLPEQRRSRIAVLRLIKAYLEIPDQDTKDAILSFVSGVAEASTPDRDCGRRGDDRNLGEGPGAEAALRPRAATTSALSGLEPDRVTPKRCDP